MYKVINRNGSVFGTEPCSCEFVCDTTDDVSTLPTSIAEGTGGKTKYDNQVCGSGSIAVVVDNGTNPKRYILDNQDVWCPQSLDGTGSDQDLSEYAKKTDLDSKADATHTHSASDVGADASGSAAAALSEAKTYTDNAVADLINGAPTTRDTLKEISDLMDENASVVEALDAAIGTKANKTDIPTKTSELDNDSGFLTKHQDLSGYAKKTDIPAELPANGGNADTVNNKKVGMSILTTLDNLGVSYADAANTIWNAIPDSTIFCRIAADFTDTSWNFPSGYANQSTLLIIKLSKNRLGGMYLYPKTGGNIFWSNVNSDGSYSGNWKKIQNEIKSVTITASTDSSGTIIIPNNDSREYISVISLSCIALPFDGSLSETRKFIAVNQNLEKQISTSVTFTAYYYDK